ncbi:universal stress protein [Sediminicola sp. 1XM1-17]|uniref:universal stress protein n=1 Tax=Sediminicola sp. 1XM1-17 TaxID=3127702 RepID=UPI0030773F39
MKKIMVPVDFSEFSEYALEVAANLAKAYGAEIQVFHMLGISESVLAANEAIEMAEAKYYMGMAKERFATFLNKDYLKGIRITEIIQNYKVFSEINELAKEQDIDLIVMGSHGSKGLSEFFVGSNTEKVVRTSAIPVLVIKQRRPQFKMEKVVFACDFKKENLFAFIHAVNLFATHGAQLNLVYVNKPNEYYITKAELDERITYFMSKVRDQNVTNMNVAYVTDYSIEHGILEYCKQIQADLVAIPTHGRKGWAHFFVGSLGENMANHAEIPVMTFRI